MGKKVSILIKQIKSGINFSGQRESLEVDYEILDTELKGLVARDLLGAEISSV